MAAILLLFGIPRRLPLGLTYPTIQVIVSLAFVAIAVYLLSGTLATPRVTTQPREVSVR